MRRSEDPARTPQAGIPSPRPEPRGGRDPVTAGSSTFAGTLAPAAERPEALSPGVLLLYGLPALRLGFLFFLRSVYLMKYAPDVLRVPPEVMGGLFLASRIWDAASDPLAG